jgi:hypothetical protein
MSVKYGQFFLAIILTFAAQYCAASSKTVYIDVIGEGDFEVVYHRAESNATGAVIAGVIGAGIQSGTEKGKDSEKEEQLRPLINKDTWRVQFLDTLNDKLVSKGYEAVWVDDTRDIAEGIVLKIYPDKYGFTMVNTSTRLVSAFITFEAIFSGSGRSEQKAAEKESYYITDRNQHPFDELLQEDSPVNAELEATLRKAAKRLANKLIYSMKE